MNTVQNFESPKVYAVRHLNEDVRAASRSGGIFTALSDAVLEDKGVVYGCVLTQDFQAVHVRAEDTHTRDLMRGSKYIQSRMGNTFRRVREDLQAGRKVLFSGTPCQVAGLKAFLGKTYENLLCVDIVCHSVPSPLVWRKYLEWQIKVNKSQVISVDFRNKTDFGWKAHVETLRLENGKKVHSRVFKTLFSGRYISRPACSECAFKSTARIGDITIGDYWHIEKAAPEMHDDKGVSLVLVNNGIGEAAFLRVLDRLRWKETQLEDSIQPAISKNFEKKAGREAFWQDFQTKSFDFIARRYGEYGCMARIRHILRVVKRRICK